MIDDLKGVDGELIRLVAPLDHDAHCRPINRSPTGHKLVIGLVLKMMIQRKEIAWSAIILSFVGNFNIFDYLFFMLQISPHMHKKQVTYLACNNVPNNIPNLTNKMPGW